MLCGDEAPVLEGGNAISGYIVPKVQPVRNSYAMAP